MLEDKVKITSYELTDIADIVSVHSAAFKGYMNASLGKGYIRSFLKWFLQFPGAITLKADFDGKVCAYAIGAPIGYGKKMNSDLMSAAVRGILLHPSVLFHQNFTSAAKAKIKMLLNKKSKEKEIINPPGRGISLVGIAVNPEFSGKKIGQKILQEFEKKATELGMNYMRLSVYDYNEKALSLYTKAGWKELTRRKKTLYYFKEISYTSIKN